METPQDRYLRVGHVNTRYWAEGGGDSNVLLVHGLGGFMENWSPCFGTLCRSHRVYAVDLIGFGRSDKPADASYCVADLAVFVKEFMTAVGIDRATVVGHSLGGATTLQLAMLFPDAVAKLAIVDSAGLGKDAALAWRVMAAPVIGGLLTRPSRSNTAQTLKLFVHDQRFVTPEDVDIHYEMWAQPGAQQILLKAMHCAVNLAGQKESMYGPIVRGLSSIKVPVLIVWGRHDKIVPATHAQVAADRLPNARVHVFDNCGHNPMREQTEAFNSLLGQFLAE